MCVCARMLQVLANMRKHLFLLFIRVNYECKKICFMLAKTVSVLDISSAVENHSIMVAQFLYVYFWREDLPCYYILFTWYGLVGVLHTSQACN